MENIDYRKKLEQVLEILNQGEELNMSNYNHDLVKQLNDTFVEAWLFIESALAESTLTSEKQLATPDVMARFILDASKHLESGYEGVVFGLESDFNREGKQKMVMYTNDLKPIKVWWVNVP